MAGLSKKKFSTQTGTQTTGNETSAKKAAKRSTRPAGKPSAPKKASPLKKAAKRASSQALARPRSAKKAAPAPPPSGERVIAEITRAMVAAAVSACEEKKAEDIRILELDAVDAGFTDFFLIASGTNERQTQSIADEVEMRLKREFGTYPNSVEGKRTGEWILLDYVDFVVHIFLAEKRAFYDIERLRKSARTVDANELQNKLTKKTATTRNRIAAKQSL